MMERFLERISLSEYKDKFILKDGMLVAAMVALQCTSFVQKMSGVVVIKKLKLFCVKLLGSSVVIKRFFSESEGF